MTRHDRTQHNMCACVLSAQPLICQDSLASRQLCPQACISCLSRSVLLLFLQGASIPEFLADQCNSISTNGSVCQGFNFQAEANMGWFKGGAAGSPLNLSRTCRSPNITTWVLNAGMVLEMYTSASSHDCHFMRHAHIAVSEDA